MAFPKSTDFDLLDWNSRADLSSDTTDSFITSSTAGIINAANNESGGYINEVSYQADSVIVAAVAPQVVSESLSTATLILPLTVSDTFTFEIDVAFPSHLPDDFSNKDRRLFAGATVKGGYTAGFLFSKQGIAIASSPYSDEAEIVILQGSDSHISWGDNAKKITIRASVFYADGRMSIYIDDTDAAFVDKEVKGTRTLRYTIPAVPTALSKSQVLLAGRSKSPTDSYDLRMAVSSLRLASSTWTVLQRPVAVINDVFRAAVGSRLRLDASDSTDSTGLPLTYAWEIEEYPDTSKEYLVGGIKASATHGIVADDNAVEFSFWKPGREGNNVEIILISQNSASPLKTELINDLRVKITLATSSNGQVLTTAQDLVGAFFNPTIKEAPGGIENTVWGEGVNSPFEGYNSEVASIIEVKLASDVSGSGVVKSGALKLAGGIGSTKQKTSLLIDIPGTYRISLVVSNGINSSLPQIATVLATHSTQLLKHRPKSDYIWQSLPDFWNLVEDKALFSTAWSAFTQVISSELLKLFQADYSKSIRDIQRKAQRKWLNFPIKVEIPKVQQNSFIPIFGGSFFVTPVVDFLDPASATSLASFSTTTKLGKLYIYDASKDFSALAVKTDHPVIVTNSSGQVGKSFIGEVSENGTSFSFGSEVLNALEVVDSGPFGGLLIEPDEELLPAGDPQLSSWILNGGENGKVENVDNGILANVLTAVKGTDFITVTTNGVPSYSVGPWPGNPNNMLGDAKTYSIPVAPKVQHGSKAQVPMGAAGVFVNGVALFNPKANNSYLSQGVWHSNAVIAEAATLDSCNGHPQETGIYHHHFNPVCLRTQLGDAGVAHSPIVGWSLDGFPIYGPYGYADAANASIKRMKSSYMPRGISKRTHLPDGTLAAFPGPEIAAEYPLGYFVEDYEHIIGLGNLDRHNGRFSSTPEYPDGVYHYHLTIDASEVGLYPYAIGPTYFGRQLTPGDVAGNMYPGHMTNLFYAKAANFRKDKIKPGDYLIAEIEGKPYSRKIVSVNPLDEKTEPITGTLEFEQHIEVGQIAKNNDGKFSVASKAGKWQIVRPANNFAKVHHVPYFRFTEGVDLSAGNTGRSSVLEIAYQSPFGTDTSFIKLPVLFAGKRSLFVEWDLLIKELNQISESKAAEVTLVFSYENLANTSLGIVPKNFYRCNDLRIHKDIVSIPFLGSKTIAPELRENIDYFIYPELLTLAPVISGDLEVVAGSDEVYISTDTDTASKITALSLLEGEIGSYKVVEMSIVGSYAKIKLSHEFRKSGTFKYTAQTMTHNSILPKQLWAELSYLKNDQVIEDNFGLYVGLPKSMLDDVGLGIDYLSIVRACHFAFLNGPSMSHLRMLSQAFMGLPYSETGGYVTSLKKDPLNKLTRVTIKPVGGKGFRTYYFPSEYSLGTHPATGRQIKILSFKDSKKQLLPPGDKEKYTNLLTDIKAGKSGEFGVITEIDEAGEVTLVEVNLKEQYEKILSDSEDAEDAIVPPYTCLVDAVDIFDYVEAPDKMAALLPGEELITQYHKFAVQVPTGELTNLNFLPLLKTFLEKAKPAYTSILFFGVMQLSDDVTVLDDMYFGGDILLADSPYSSPFIKKSFHVPLGNIPGGYTGQTTAQQYPQSYPKAKTLQSQHSTVNDPSLLGPDGAVTTAVGHTLGDGNAFVATGNEILLQYQVSALGVPSPKILQKLSKGFKLRLVDDYPETGGYVEFQVASTTYGIMFLVGGTSYTLYYLKMEDSSGTPIIYDNLNRKTSPANVALQLQDEHGKWWDYKTDVFDAYEAGYVTGVLDDYSGDGSWNENHQVLDFVNELDSDLDVFKTKVWIPIEVQTPSDDSVEFTVGEEVEFRSGAAYTDSGGDAHPDDELLSGFGWDSVVSRGFNAGSPPRTLHVGSGHHPKVPFGVYSPQIVHPHTYLILEFADAAKSGDYGTEDRLKAFKRLVEWAATTNLAILKIRGTTSGASATMKTMRGDFGAASWKPMGTTLILPNYEIARDVEHADHSFHKPYFIQDDIFHTDKLLETGPEIESDFSATQYIPAGGALIKNFDITHFIKVKPDGIKGVDPHPGLVTADKQLQVHPWDPSTDGAMTEGHQFVPSFGPGFFKSWSDKTENDYIVYGWTDAGDLSSAPVTTFASAAGSSKLENLHVGIRGWAHKDYHYTHGFTGFGIPEPLIIAINPISSGYDLRIEGHYFVDFDTTQTSIPTASPPSGGPYGFNGTIGGSWIFFKNKSTGTETAVSEVHFETGLHPGKFINGLSGASQKSDGHVLEVHIPVLPDSGTYDIILRQYRPFKWTSAGTQQYHVDEVTYPEAFYYSSPISFAGGAWGSGPFGG